MAIAPRWDAQSCDQPAADRLAQALAISPIVAREYTENRSRDVYPLIRGRRLLPPLESIEPQLPDPFRRLTPAAQPAALEKNLTLALMVQNLPLHPLERVVDRLRIARELLRHFLVG